MFDVFTYPFHKAHLWIWNQFIFSKYFRSVSFYSRHNFWSCPSRNFRTSCPLWKMEMVLYLKLKYFNVSLFQVFLWQTVLLGWHDMMTDWMVILLAIVQFSRKSFKSSFESNLLQNNTVWGFFSSDCPWVGSWKMIWVVVKIWTFSCEKKHLCRLGLGTNQMSNKKQLNKVVIYIQNFM